MRCSRANGRIAPLLPIFLQDTACCHSAFCPPYSQRCVAERRRGCMVEMASPAGVHPLYKWRVLSMNRPRAAVAASNHSVSPGGNTDFLNANWPRNRCPFPNGVPTPHRRLSSGCPNYLTRHCTPSARWTFRPDVRLSFGAGPKAFPNRSNF